jgi:hypothetical protein
VSDEAEPAEPGAKTWRAKLGLGAHLATLFCVFVLYANAFVTKPGMFLAMICTTLGYYPCVWIHELGHAAAAVMVRWRVIIFAVRPFAWHFGNRELARMMPRDRAELGGYVFAVPSSLRTMTVGRDAIYVLGGPTFNIAFAAGAVWAAYHWLPFSREFGGRANLAAIALGLQSLHLAIGALIPSRSPRWYSDGQTLIDLFRGRKTWREGRPLAIQAALGAYKVRLAEQPQWLIDAIETDAASSEEAAHGLAAVKVGRLLDAGASDPAAVRAAIEAYHAQFGDNEWLACCDAYLIAVHEGDGARAAERMWQGEQLEALEPLRMAAEAGIAARLGDAEAAAAKLDRMDEALARASSFADLSFRDIRRRIEAIR